MATWKIPVTWPVGGCVYVTAETLEEAVKIAKDKEGVIPLPDDPDYVDSSWRVEGDIDYIRSGYNGNQPDD